METFEDYSNIKSYGLLFDIPFTISDDLDDFLSSDEFLSLSKKKQEDFLKEIGVQKKHIEDYYIDYVIYLFTRYDIPYSEKLEVIKNLKNINYYIKDVYIKRNNQGFNELIIDTKRGIIKVKPLSKMYPSLNKKYPDLENENREGRCFETLDLIQDIDGDCDLVGGYIYGKTDKSKFLHFWIETRKNDEDVVIDYTLNAEINKEGYYLFRNVNEGEIITRLKKEIINDNLKTYKKLINLLGFNNEEFSLFHDEIIKDLQKNRFLIENNDTVKSHYDLFDLQTKRAKYFDRKYNELKEEGSKEKIINFLKEKKVKELYEIDYLIQYLIQAFTLKNQDEFLKLFSIVKNIKPYVKSAKVVINEKYNSKELIIETINGVISTLILSDVIPDIKRLFNDIETENRSHKCFSSAYTLSLNLNNPSVLVSGYIYGSSDKAKYLHSFVETKLNDEDVVIDVSTNSITNKEGFYKLKHVEEIEKIDSKDLIHDYQKYIDLINLISLKQDTYNFFRTEFNKDFERIEENFKKKGAL